MKYLKMYLTKEEIQMGNKYVKEALGIIRMSCAPRDVPGVSEMEAWENTVLGGRRNAYQRRLRAPLRPSNSSLSVRFRTKPCTKECSHQAYLH